MTERGEGWEWPRVQHEPCPQCGFDPSSLLAPALARALLVEAMRWQRFIVGADDDRLRSPWRPEVWTPLQYAVHARDMLTVYRSRMLCALQGADPLLPSFEPSPDIWIQYNEMPPPMVAAAINEAARGLIDVLAHDPGPSWSRPAHRDDGVRFTVIGMARFALHEAHHHLLDATGALLRS